MAVDWRRAVITKRIKGRGGEKDTAAIVPCESTVIGILRHHPAWRGVIAYDLFRSAIVTTRPPPWHHLDAPKAKSGLWVDGDDVRLTSWIARTLGVRIPTTMLRNGVIAAAD